MPVDASQPARKRSRQFQGGVLQARASHVPISVVTGDLERQLRDGWLADQRRSLFHYYGSSTLHMNAPGMTAGGLFSGQQGFRDEGDGC